MNEKRRYSLRLKDRFAFYDIAKTQMWHEWAAGAIVTNPDEIALLESIHAPVENIFEGEFLR
jgi:hypothetical protein